MNSININLSISLIVLIIVFILEYVFKLIPCDMCLVERYPYYALILLSIIAMYLVRIEKAKLRKIIDLKLPRMEKEPPPVQYPIQVCIDLLDAKQAAIDNNVPFTSDVICLRCQSVFDSLDVAYDICSLLAEDYIPEGLQEKIRLLISDE